MQLWKPYCCLKVHFVQECTLASVTSDWSKVTLTATPVWCRTTHTPRCCRRWCSSPCEAASASWSSLGRQPPRSTRASPWYLQGQSGTTGGHTNTGYILHLLHTCILISIIIYYSAYILVPKMLIGAKPKDPSLFVCFNNYFRFNYFLTWWNFEVFGPFL